MSERTNLKDRMQENNEVTSISTTISKIGATEANPLETMELTESAPAIVVRNRGWDEASPLNEQPTVKRHQPSYRPISDLPPWKAEINHNLLPIPTEPFRIRTFNDTLPFIPFYPIAHRPTFYEFPPDRRRRLYFVPEHLAEAIAMLVRMEASRIRWGQLFQQPHEKPWGIQWSDGTETNFNVAVLYSFAKLYNNTKKTERLGGRTYYADCCIEGTCSDCGPWRRYWRITPPTFSPTEKSLTQIRFDNQLKFRICVVYEKGRKDRAHDIKYMIDGITELNTLYQSIKDQEEAEVTKGSIDELTETIRRIELNQNLAYSLSTCHTKGLLFSDKEVRIEEVKNAPGKKPERKSKRAGKSRREEAGELPSVSSPLVSTPSGGATQCGRTGGRGPGHQETEERQRQQCGHPEDLPESEKGHEPTQHPTTADTGSPSTVNRNRKKRNVSRRQ